MQLLITVQQIHPDPLLYENLERGNLLLFPRTPWDIPADDQVFLRSIDQKSRGYHKNIAYRPTDDRVTGFEARNDADAERLHSILKNFSRDVLGFLRSLLPQYANQWHVDYASFRPFEEEGRDLPFNKRNDLLHIDAFPSRPTRGDLILRTFANISETQSRVWLTSDPFEKVARDHAEAAGWPRIAKSGALAQLFSRREPYDRFMLGFHDYLKGNRDYQDNCQKYRWEFPPGSAWMVFTDVVPHAVLSGRYALEQTVIISRSSLQSRDRAPIEILNKLLSTSTR